MLQLCANLMLVSNIAEKFQNLCNSLQFPAFEIKTKSFCIKQFHLFDFSNLTILDYHGGWRVHFNKYIK